MVLMRSVCGGGRGHPDSSVNGYSLCHWGQQSIQDLIILCWPQWQMEYVEVRITLKPVRCPSPIVSFDDFSVILHCRIEIIEDVERRAKRSADPLRFKQDRSKS